MNENLTGRVCLLLQNYLWRRISGYFIMVSSEKPKWNWLFLSLTVFLSDSVVFDTSALHLVKKCYTWLANSHCIGVVSSEEIQVSGDPRSSVHQQLKPHWVESDIIKTIELNPGKSWAKLCKFLSKEKKFLHAPTLHANWKVSLSRCLQQLRRHQRPSLRGAPLPHPQTVLPQGTRKPLRSTYFEGLIWKIPLSRRFPPP